MNVLGRYPQKWRAFNEVKAIKGAVAYEFKNFAGEDVRVPFEPRVEYDEASEPQPWVVVF